MTSPHSQLVHFDEPYGAGLRVETSGYIATSFEGSTSVLGTTVSSFSNFGLAVIPMPTLSQTVASTDRLFSLGVPIAGTRKTIVILGSSSSGIVNLDATTAANFVTSDLITPNRYLVIATSGVSTGAGALSPPVRLELAGMSTAAWVVVDCQPTSGYVASATTQ